VCRFLITQDFAVVLDIHRHDEDAILGHDEQTGSFSGSMTEAKGESRPTARSRFREFFKGQTQEPGRLLRVSMIVGFGFHLTWVFAVLYLSFPAFFTTDAETAQAFRTLGIIIWVVSIAVMLLMAYFIERITFNIRRRLLQLAIAIAMAMGTTLLVIADLYSSIPLIIIADIICGASSAFFYLIWSEAYRRRVITSIVVNAALSIVFAIILFAVLLWALPVHLSSLILCVLPLAEVTALEFSLHGGKALIHPQRFDIDDNGRRLPAPGLLEVPTFHRLHVKREMFLIRQGLPAFLLGLGMGPMCRQAFTMLLSMFESQESPVWLVVFASIAILCVVMTFILLNLEEKSDTFYQGVVPVLAITMLFSGFVSTGLSWQLMSLLGYLFFVFLVWVEFCGLSHRYRISPILITGFGRAFALIGMLVCTTMLDNLYSSGLEVSSVVVNTCLIFVTVLGYLLLPREKDIRALAIIEPLKAEEQAKPEESPEEFRQGRFMARCERVANTYLLSSRETDVFFLLAKGRNAAYIAQHLFISEGTVHTHTWRIYRKLNIHNQQELMNLVDNYSRNSEAVDIRG
jgi:DNA-binding CsgD family transcriptional regulator